MVILKASVRVWHVMFQSPHVFSTMECYFWIFSAFAHLNQHFEIRVVNSSQYFKNVRATFCFLYFANVISLTAFMHNFFFFWEPNRCSWGAIHTHSCTAHRDCCTSLVWAGLPLYHGQVANRPGPKDSFVNIPRSSSSGRPARRSAFTCITGLHYKFNHWHIGAKRPDHFRGQGMLRYFLYVRKDRQLWQDIFLNQEN